MNLLQAVILGLGTFVAGYAVAYLVMTIGVNQDK
jgi:hypothetical protein